MGTTHVLVVPYPAQGHVIPLMEFAHCLVDAGFRVTFVNTDHNHRRMVAALSKKAAVEVEQMHLVSVPDGLPPDANRNDVGLLSDSVLRIMTVHLEELIRKTNESDDDKITWVIADESMACALDMAKKMGLRSAAFWPAAAAVLASMLGIPKLIEAGVIDSDGLQKKETFQLGPGMPWMTGAHLVWNLCGDEETQRMIYRYVLGNNRATESAEFIVCNSFADVERPIFGYAANILPVGPLLTGRRFGRPVGHFWLEDSACTAWLDEQPAGSVVYVSFGSFTIFGERQFQELALGLELSGRPFLWVVRPDLTSGAESSYPTGFVDRVAGRGRMVEWAPQQRVLAHPSVVCFLSHCGWNSTMEGVTNGVPFLCWPYLFDQPLNRDYICDSWRTGLGLTADEEGFVTKEEIRTKLDALLGDEGIRKRAVQLKEAALRNVEPGGASYENFRKVVEIMKG